MPLRSSRMARQKPPAPVVKIDFADNGQDCTTWYVRNRIIIDCEPCLPRTWVGVHVVRPPLRPAAAHHDARAAIHRLPVRLPGVTELPREEAELVIARWKDLMREELGSGTMQKRKSCGFFPCLSGAETIHLLPRSFTTGVSMKRTELDGGNQYAHKRQC